MIEPTGAFLIASTVMAAASGIAARVVDGSRGRATYVAETLGLARRGRALTGLYRGVPVLIDSGPTNRGYVTTARFRLAEALPPGLRIGRPTVWRTLRRWLRPEETWEGLRDLTRALDIRGARPIEIADLLTHGHVHPVLVQTLATGGVLYVDGLELTLERAGHHLDHARRVLDEGVHLVQTLARARRDAWLDLARERGLVTDARAVHLTGLVDGIPMDVWFESGSVVARLQTPLPRGTLVLHADHAVPDQRTPTPLSDPVLDGRVVAYSTDPTTLRERLVHDEVRGPLLEVVHGYPGSMLTDTHVRLSLGWAAERVHAAFASAHRLAVSLRDPAGPRRREP